VFDAFGIFTVARSIHPGPAPGPRCAALRASRHLGGLTAAVTGQAGDAAGGAVRIRAQSRVLAVSVVDVAVAGAGGAVLGADAVAGQAAIVPTVAIDRQAGQAEPAPTGAEAGGAPVRIARRADPAAAGASGDAAAVELPAALEQGV